MRPPLKILILTFGFAAYLGHRMYAVCLICRVPWGIVVNRVVVGLRRRFKHCLERREGHARNHQKALRGEGEKPEAVHRRTLSRSCPGQHRFGTTGLRGRHAHRCNLHHRQPEVLR